jgi:hypothetical protein
VSNRATTTCGPPWVVLQHADADVASRRENGVLQMRAAVRSPEGKKRCVRTAFAQVVREMLMVRNGTAAAASSAVVVDARCRPRARRWSSQLY